MEKMINTLAGFKGFTFVGCTYENEVRMNKTGNPYYGRVTKRVEGTFCFNGSYENMVNNKIDRKGVEGEDFKSAPLVWGQWMAGAENRIITHKGETYVRLYPHPNGCKTTYFLDGREVWDAELEYIKQFFPTRKPSAKQENAGLSKDEQVIPLAIKVSNIKKLSIKGQEFSF